MGNAEATPRPWQLDQRMPNAVFAADEIRSKVAATTAGHIFPDRSSNEAAANAEPIVRTVNAHDALVAALELALAEHDHRKTMQVMLTEPTWVGEALTALRLAKHGSSQVEQA